MKFGKRMLLIMPERFLDKRFQYRDLKAFIRDHSPAKGVTLTPEEVGAVSKEFEDLVADQVDAVTAFAETLPVLAEERVATLMDTWKEVKAVADPVVESNALTTSAGAGAGAGVGPTAPAAVTAVADAGASPGAAPDSVVTGAVKDVVCRHPGEPSLPLSEELIDTLVHAPRHAAVVDAYDLITEIEEYCQLSLTAVTKITKKFDKVFGTELSAKWATRMATSPLQPLCNLQHIRQSAVEFLAKTKLKPRPHRSPDTKELGAPHKGPVSVATVPIVHTLRLKDYPPGKHVFRVICGTDTLSQAIAVPVMLVVGRHDGPVVLVTSALHGNEVAGIPVIHALYKVLNYEDMHGTLVCVPVVNLPGYDRCQRGYSDGVDLNRICPGKSNGSASQIFMHRFMTHIVRHCAVLLDLHTASFGRRNSLYVRADLSHPVVHRCAMLLNADLVVHSSGPDGSLRSAATDIGMTALTVEVGHPQVVRQKLVSQATRGIQAVLRFLNVVPHAAPSPVRTPILCSRSYWIFTKGGGVLKVLPECGQWVAKGQVIAILTNIFGEVVRRMQCPEDGVVVGHSSNPVARSGDRVLHLGVVGSSLPVAAHDGHE